MIFLTIRHVSAMPRLWLSQGRCLACGVMKLSLFSLYPRQPPGQPPGFHRCNEALGTIMTFHKIMRIPKQPPRADKSAPTDGRMILLMCIIGPYEWLDDFVHLHYRAPTPSNLIPYE